MNLPVLLGETTWNNIVRMYVATLIYYVQSTKYSILFYLFDYVGTYY